jgi:hypothetical protein
MRGIICNMRTFLFLVLALPAFAESGWISLFDGRSLEGWMWSTDANPPAPAWRAENGMLRTTPGDGKPVYLLTRESFTDFEMEFDWKMEEGGNSGVKYRFQGYWVKGQARPEPEGPERIEPIGLEYQIIDDARHPDALSDPKHATGAIYEYWPANKGEAVRPDVWHTSRIVARGLHIEHWLDGKKVLDVDLSATEVQQSFAASRRRGSSPLLAKHERRTSPVALQFHDGIVWFRNLKIRRL